MAIINHLAIGERLLKAKATSRSEFYDELYALTDSGELSERVAIEDMARAKVFAEEVPNKVLRNAFMNIKDGSAIVVRVQPTPEEVAAAKSTGRKVHATYKLSRFFAKALHGIPAPKLTTENAKFYARKVLKVAALLRGAKSRHRTRKEETMIYLTRRADFSASHYYHDPALSPEENLRVFGKCSNLNGHGHNYILEITVKGSVDPKTGFVVDLKDLKDLMESEVVSAMDHRHLNKEVLEFAKLNPTTENLAIVIWNRLAPKLQVAKLHRVRVYESDDLFADFYGEA